MSSPPKQTPKMSAPDFGTPLGSPNERVPSPSPRRRPPRYPLRLVDWDDDDPQIVSESLPAPDPLSLRERLVSSRLQRRTPLVAEVTAATLRQTMQDVTERLRPFLKERAAFSEGPDTDQVPPRYTMPSAAPPYEAPAPPEVPDDLLWPRPPPDPMTTAERLQFTEEMIAFCQAAAVRYTEIIKALDEHLAWEAARDKAANDFWAMERKRYEKREEDRRRVVAENEEKLKCRKAVDATIAAFEMELDECAYQLSRLESTDILIAVAERHLMRLLEEARRIDGLRRTLREPTFLGEHYDLALEVLHFPHPPLDHFIAPITNTNARSRVSISSDDNSSQQGEEGAEAGSPKVDRSRSPSDFLLPFPLTDLLPSGITSADAIRRGVSVANPADDFGIPVPPGSFFGRGPSSVGVVAKL
ncbi:hypothetical protein B0H11DRAFT_2234963 [Mycena galericulata]|nr:hypothetical protein B0H11DRAFT_2234963 [Mycena galericulata]